MLRDRLKTILKILKVTSIAGTGGLFVFYHYTQTCKSINRVVNPNVMETEKTITPEYIYINDPSYEQSVQMEEESRQAVGFTRIWKSLKHSVAWRLLWLARHGNREQRNIALEQLAQFKHKAWDCVKLAQALDERTAVLLARTRGVDLRYFLPPPIHVRRAALSPELMSFKIRDLIVAVQAVNPHSCIQSFLHKHFANVQEQAMEADSILTKPDSISEHDLCLICLDALHHHLSVFHSRDYKDNISAVNLIQAGLLQTLSEILLRYRYDIEIDLAILKILTLLSIHTELLQLFFQNGLLGELARWLKSDDIKFASSAAVCLTNLSGEGSYRPGLFLLHPLYRTAAPPACDMLLVHGLSGGVFVTWRQRDKKPNEPVGLFNTAFNSMDSSTKNRPKVGDFMDPEFQQVMEDLIEIDEERLLADYDVVLRDIPIEAKREPPNYTEIFATRKREGLNEEIEDGESHSFCWPKDWLPKDMKNLRIMGINYWSSLSEWLGHCPLMMADIASRATELTPALVEASVGSTVPLVWLAHSMGGLIVKQILTSTAGSKESSENKISENTKAIVFFSTPHKGSALATMPRAASAILWPSSDVRQLTQNSPMLLKLHAEFLKYADMYNWETICFAEALPTLVTAFKVPVHFVESDSADLGRGVFYQLPLDHLSICKPATRQSILYTTVLDLLDRVIVRNIEFNFYNSHVMKFIQVFKQLTNKNDDHSNSLRWFDKLLLDAFTDGFTD